MGYNINGDYYTHTFSNASKFNSKKGDISCMYCGVRLGKEPIDLCLELDRNMKRNNKKNGTNKAFDARRHSDKSGKGRNDDKRKR